MALLYAIYYRMEQPYHSAKLPNTQLRRLDLTWPLPLVFFLTAHLLKSITIYSQDSTLGGPGIDTDETAMVAFRNGALTAGGNSLQAKSFGATQDNPGSSDIFDWPNHPDWTCMNPAVDGNAGDCQYLLGKT